MTSIEAVASLFAQANNVSLRLESPEVLPQAYVDPDKIFLVFQNLIDNAIKYIKGQGEVKVILREENNFIKVAISDTGVGIPQSQQKYIFKKFFRSDNIMKYQTIGTGLGLFIAKAAIKQNNGQIWFESKEGKRTTFYFTLPIYK